MRAGIRIERVAAAFAIRDDRGRSLAYVYFQTVTHEIDPGHLMKEEEALEYAKICARAIADYRTEACDKSQK